MNKQKQIYSIKSQEQKKYYNKTADKYDKWHVEPASAKIVDAWNFKNLKKFLNGEEMPRCLDMGCGTGRLTNKLFAICDEVYGVDQSAKVLKIAARKYPKLKLSCAEVINLPYHDNFFNMVVINGSLHHFFAVKKTLREAHRVLKPGGVLALLGEPNKQFMKLYNPFFYTWIFNRIIIKVIDLFKEKEQISNELIEPEAEKYIPRILKKEIESTGFEVKRFYTYDYFARNESKVWLEKYPQYLNFENKYIAKIFKNLGMAIQCFAIKK